MTKTEQSAPEDPFEVSAPTALAYETTEEARLLLDGANSEISQARAAAGEAAYYLSDTLEPEDRISLLVLAERRSEPLSPNEAGEQARAKEALALLADTAVEVEEMLRGPTASSELHVALSALRGAIWHVVNHIGAATNHINVNAARNQRLSTLCRLGAKHK